MAFRFSNRPHKQFLWFLIRKDSKLGKGMDLGLDAGCADMRNRRFFQTKQYIGLDPDDALLHKGRQNNPGVETLTCTIQDMPKGVQADFVQCIQVFVNADFVNEEAVDATQKLVSAVRKGGVLLLNTGKQTIQYDPAIVEILEDNFSKVKEIRYGNLRIKSLPMPLSFLVAFMMLVLPVIRTLGGHSKTYFCCIDRK
jgi:trans-aconitate methyltransferase